LKTSETIRGDAVAGCSADSVDAAIIVVAIQNPRICLPISHRCVVDHAEVARKYG
jgi:hypothetical protein